MVPLSVAHLALTQHFLTTTMAARGCPLLYPLVTGQDTMLFLPMVLPVTVLYSTVSLRALATLTLEMLTEAKEVTAISSTSASSANKL